MCDFKVYSGTQEKQRLIAEEITNVKLNEDSLILTDIVGRTTKVEGALITGVDVKKESLQVYSSPFIFELLRLFLSCEQQDWNALNELESAWKALKARGDEIMDSLKWTKGGVRH